MAAELLIEHFTLSQHMIDAAPVRGEMDPLYIWHCINPESWKEGGIFLIFSLSVNIYMKVLILCTGNSCRSQMAHGFLQSFDSKIKVCSAGTRPASTVSRKAVKVMAEIGIDISNHIPRSVDEYLNEQWDYVITVCDSARESCPHFTGSVKNKLHIGFEDPSEFKGTDEEVLDEFRRTRDNIRVAFYNFFRNHLT